MKLLDLGPYEIHLPTSGGKAGVGKNTTSSIQVRSGGVILAAFRFVMADPMSGKKAAAKAREFILHHARAGPSPMMRRPGPESHANSRAG